MFIEQSKKIKIDKAINLFIAHLQQQAFSTNLIQKYNSHLQKFKSFFLNNSSKNSLDITLFTEYMNSLHNCSSHFINFSRTVLNKFSIFCLNTPLKNSFSDLTCLDFNNIFNLYKDFLKSSTIKYSTQISQLESIYLFLKFLEKNNIYSLFNSKLSKYIFKYTNNNNFAHATKVNYSKNLRKFFNFAFEHSFMPISGNDLFPKIHINSRERILSFYSCNEISSMISCVNTSTAIGKRDYAIILLAAILGLRASDLSNLSIKNFDWDKKILTIYQQKTNKKLVQPFPDEVLYAILDYVKNGRPDSASDFIFLTSRAPFGRISPSGLSAMITKYFNLSKINISSRKHGIHSLRHSLANNMLHNNVSLQDISASLGHLFISTTTMYTNIDICTLKSLSLEVCS